MKKLGVILTIICILNLIGFNTIRALSVENITKLEEDFNSENKDFAFLSESLKDKKIIGIGDNSLGIRESSNTKYNLTAYLIKEFGYKSIIIDAPVGATEQLNGYVTTGNGEIDSAVRSTVLLNNNTEEFTRFVSWLKDYNLGKPVEEMVTFHGRLNYYIGKATVNITMYLDRVDKEAYKKAIDPLYKTDGFSYQYYYLKLIGVDEIYKEINDLYKDFLSKEEEYIKKTSEKEYKMILNKYKVVLQTITDLYDKANGRQIANRNTLDLEIIKDILEVSKDNKGILWTSNMNLTKEVLDGKNNLIRLGQNLRDEFGEEYFSIATDINEGDSVVKLFNYSEVTNRPYDEMPVYRKIMPLEKFNGGLIEEFSNVAYNTFYVDTKNSSYDYIANSLNFDENGYKVKVLNFDFKENFDGIIYTKKATEVNHFSITNFIRGEEADNSFLYFSLVICMLLIIFSIFWERYKSKKDELYEKLISKDDDEI